jgi:hypothetical protein
VFSRLAFDFPIRHAAVVVGDAIAAIIEGLVAFLQLIVEAFLALLQLIAEAIAFLVQGSVTVVGYLLFPAYRDRKNLEWRDRPGRKVLALSFSGLCLATLCGLGLWLLTSAHREARATAATPPAANRGSNFVSFAWQRTNSVGSNQSGQIVINTEEVAELLAATNRADLLTRVKSIMLTTNATDGSGTNSSPGRSFQFNFGRSVTEK